MRQIAAMEVNMQTGQISQSFTDFSISHVSVATGLPYDRLIEAFEGSLGKWDPIAGVELWKEKASWPDVEAAIAKMAAPFGLMILSKIDQGRITSLSGKPKMCLLYLVGNPVIANRIIEIDLRGSFYVPFRVAVHDDGGPTGGIISYDRPSSFLAALNRPELDAIGKSLDEKLDRVISNLNQVKV
jgi:uncharacterized protein (DUF302 family)